MDDEKTDPIDGKKPVDASESEELGDATAPPSWLAPPEPPEPPEPPAPPRRWRRLRVAVAALLILILMTLGGLYMGYRAILATLPKLDHATDYQPLLPTVVYDMRGQVVAEYGEQRRILVPREAIPKHVVDAFLAAEDASFFSHGGINIIAIVRAAIKNFTSGTVKQGASTITQQVTKTFFLSPERTIWRKLREVGLAFRLEEVLTKDEILYLYLNQIFFGAGAYGVESAANVYFAKSISDVTVAEAAILAGLPKAPSAYSPYEHPGRARQRQLYVLEQMERNNFLTAEEAAVARSEAVPIRLWRNPSNRSGYYTEQVRRYLVDTYGEEKILRGGFRVETSMDLEQQLAAQQAVRNGVLALEKRHGYRGPVTRIARADRTDFLARLMRELNRPEAGDVIQVVGPDLLAADDIADLPEGGEEPASAQPDEELEVAAELTKGSPPARPFRAMVLEVNQERALVGMGLRQAFLPLFEAAWAMPFDVARRSEDYPVRDLRRVLKVGDVIWVEHVDLARLARGSAEDKKLAEQWKPVKRGESVWPVTLVPQPEVQGALVAIDPETAEVRALVGGFDFHRSHFNRATQARRQPGSAFKPVVYAAAVLRGANPATMVVDSPDIFEEMAEGATEVTYWKPKNYDDTFSGPITLREALARSRNVPTLRIAQDVGISAIRDMAQQLGIFSPQAADFSIALGSNGVSLMEMVNVYNTFASDGIRREPRIIRRVLDRDGRLIEQQVPDWVLAVTRPADKSSDRVAALRKAFEPLGPDDLRYYKAERILSADQNHLMLYMLRAVVEGGTGWRSRRLGRPLGGKTGTTNDNVDSWFIGFTPDLVAGVWLGFDQPERNLGRYETGSIAANPVFNEFMFEAHHGLPVRDWVRPENIVYLDIDYATGLPAAAFTEKKFAMPFIAGTEPREQTTEELQPSEVDLFKLDMGF